MPDPNVAASAAPETHLMGVYSRAPLAFERGEGVWLYTADERRYLDCVAGIAVDALGHCHPKLVEALKGQAEKLWHVSNIFQIPGQEELAARLCASSFADEVFFTNSGTEAIELALKVARKYQAGRGAPEKIDIITFQGAFHGRTYGALNAGGNATYLDGFGPRMPGFVQIAYGDEEALKAAITPTTGAMLIEPVQGEGGARSVDPSYLRLMRELCDANDLLLMFDEIQCGMGRTGKLWAYEHAGVEPDVMTVAKALGGGFPVGAVLTRRSASEAMTVGAHGTTYGGNPLAMAVANAAVEEIDTPQMMQHVEDVAGYFGQQLHGLQERYPEVIEEIRGKGLLIGLKLKPNNRQFMAVARDQGLLIAGGGENTCRLLPPLIISQAEAREAVEKLEAACQAVRQKAAD